MKFQATCLFAGLMASSLLAIGCQPGQEEEELDPAAIKLEGRPDPQFVGTWENDKGATYVFKEDGTYSLRNSVKAQQGSFEIKVDAEWRLNGTKLLMQDAGKNVVPYNFKLEGSKLTLTSTGTSKMETVLNKKP